MSTKAIRELIEDAGRRDDSRRYELTQKALAELEAIEKAARHMTAFARGESVSDPAVSYARIILEDIAKESAS